MRLECLENENLNRMFGAVKQYVQGRGVLKDLYGYAQEHGSRFMVIGSAHRLGVLDEKIRDSFKGHEDQLVYAPFSGECTRAEAARLAGIAKEKQCDCIISVGGGKAADVAKAAANYDGEYPTLVVGTTPSCDGYMSGITVFYNDDHSADGIAFYMNSPVLVMIDLDIAITSGERMLIAGMGDAISTFYEARPVVEGHYHNYVDPQRGKFTNTSWALAKLTRDTLMDKGLQAVLAARRGVITPAYEDIVETTVLTSALGWQNNGACTAHEMIYGFEALPGSDKHLHGEWVAFCTQCQLVLENRPVEEIDQLVRWCMSVGLSVCFEDVDMPDITPDQLDIIADVAYEATGGVIHMHPFKVTKELIKAAIQGADEIGRLYRAGGSLI